MSRHALFTILSACHLLLVACGAARFCPAAEHSPLRQPLALYGSLSGASAGYGFFAPSVASQLRVSFTLQDADGETWTDALEESASREVNLRFSTMVGTFALPQVRTQLAKSWAGTMLARNPDAERVIVHVEMYQLPSTSYYRAGHRPQWTEVYRGTFAARNRTVNHEER